MAEDKIAGIMREFVGVLASTDMEKTLAYFTDDASLTNPFGTFKGRNEIRRTLNHMANRMRDVKVTESGNGIIVQGDRAFFEHTITGISNNNRFEFLAMCSYQFEGDKIKDVKMVYDRLELAHQVVTGWPGRPLVNMMVKQSEKGLE